MSEAKPIYLHAGAHRTGTSSFQIALSKNRAAIEAAGYDLAYPGRDDIPGGDLGLRLPNPRNEDQWEKRFAPAVAEEIARLRPNPQRALILSEENLPGRMLHFASGLFYPTAEARFRAFRVGSAAPVARLLFVIRDYAGLYVSAYRKRAEDRLVHPFEEERVNKVRMDRGWPEIIAAMQAELRPAKLIVVDYRNRGDSLALLRRLVPDLAYTSLDEPRRRMNASATDAALEALQARYKAGETLDRATWQKIVEDHKDDTASRGLSEFTPRQLSKLRQSYEDDVARLAAMPGIEFIP